MDDRNELFDDRIVLRPSDLRTGNELAVDSCYHCYCRQTVESAVAAAAVAAAVTVPAGMSAMAMGDVAASR